VVIRPSGKTFITGIAINYYREYPDEKLAGILTETNYKKVVQEINSTIFGEWP
jgi:hypothetical protein